MKFRGNICVQDRFGSRVYFFTNTHGLDTFVVLQDALELGKEVWDDDQFFSRVLFDSMLVTDENAELDEFGVSGYLGENDLPVFLLDMLHKRIFMEEGRCLASCPCVGYVWTFEEFMKLKEDPRLEYLRKTLEQ